MASHFGRAGTAEGIANAVRGWSMVTLTLIFVLLYGAALTGWARPLADEKMVSRLEPLIFVIIGYYFGRLPSQQNENTLKSEINRQTQKADAVQHAREQAQQAREILEEKMKNTRAALASTAPGLPVRSQAENFKRTDSPTREESLRQSVTAALNILDS